METALWQSLCLVQLLSIVPFFHVSHALILNDPGPQFFDNAFRVTWTKNLSDPVSFRLTTFPPLPISPQEPWLTSDEQAMLSIGTDRAFRSSGAIVLLPSRLITSNITGMGPSSPLFMMRVKDDQPAASDLLPSISSDIVTTVTAAITVSSNSSSPSNTPPSDTSSSNIMSPYGAPGRSQDAYVTSNSDNASATKLSASTSESTTLDGLANSMSASTSLTNTVTQTQVTPPDAPSPKKSPVRAIVGGSVGGSVLLLAISIYALVVARRRRNDLPPDAIVVPLAHDQNYSQPLDKRGQLQQVLLEKAEAQRQRDVLQTNLVECNRTADGSANLPDGENEAHMRQQMELMGQRILELEAQQDELMGNMRPLDEEQPPSYF